jgi:ABC-type dipeptide/oligopeptide/nickel transport system permease subunit
VLPRELVTFSKTCRCTCIRRRGWPFWPAVALSLAVFGFNMLGDALRGLLDARLRGG